ncbi:flavin reductase family protein [Microbacterium tumbae]
MILEPVDAAALRGVFSEFPSGVAALAAVADGSPEILIASSFQVGISLDPPMVLFAVQRSSTTWPVLSRASRIGVSILSSGHAGIVRQLAGRDKAARFDNVGTTVTESGALLLDEASVWLECEVTHDYDAGDHRLIVFTVGSVARSGSDPLVFHRSGFHRATPLTAA